MPSRGAGLRTGDVLAPYPEGKPFFASETLSRNRGGVRPRVQVILSSNASGSP